MTEEQNNNGGDGVLPAQRRRFSKGAWARLALLAVALLAAAGWLWLRCQCDPKVKFLPSSGNVRWIVCAEAPSAFMRRDNPRVVFEKEFVLDRAPDNAALSWRVFGGGRLWINDVPVELRPADSNNWKVVSKTDVARFLKQGTNDISFGVSNSMAPPSLWLSLRIGDWTLDTDSDWAVIDGKQRVLPAWPAGRPAEYIQPESTRVDVTLGGALRRKWAVLALVLAAGFGAALTLERAGSFFSVGGTGKTRRGLIVWGLLACAWLALLLHNSPRIPPELGFDAGPHMEYTAFIQEHHRLPEATEGFMMYQPPLYYLLSAGTLGLGGLDAADADSAFTMRALSAMFGIFHVLLALACLRLLFPGKPALQMVGTALAALLPAHLYLMHFATNETLAAALTAGALYCALRAARHERPISGWHWLAGLAFGAAMMAKVSALMAAPFVFGALAWGLVENRRTGVRHWLGALVGPLALALAICGPFYWHMAARYGSPLAGNWTPAIFPAWWQYPGCRTADYYFSFGQSLAHPFFSAYYSFGDAMHSTLWGDGFCGGSIGVEYGPPWDYDLMTLGYWLALAPALAALIGFARLVAEWAQRPRVEGFMMAGFIAAAGFSLVYMSLKNPLYSQKAFYALPALLPFCVCGAAGVEYLLRFGTAARVLSRGLFIAWALNVYLTFWVCR